MNGDIDAADDRTLRLSAPDLTPERLARLIKFQPPAKEAQAARELPDEIRQRSALTRLERRYGEATIALLHARENELLAPHEAIGQIARR